MDKRFIEESFPVKEVSVESAREKYIRHSHISTLHVWWARKPLASSRAINYAALIPAPKDEIDWVKKRNFIIKLSKWENSCDNNILEQAKEEIFENFNGKFPKVLDPFSGGGAIPLEAQRLGCETYANDYNPVAVFLEKCTIEYPQKYGKTNSEDWQDEDNSFVQDIRKSADIVFEKSNKILSKFYPKDNDGSMPVGYYWMRTIKCLNPACELEIPLTTSWWLSRTNKNKIALQPILKDSKIDFEIIGVEDEIPDSFDPNHGTISRAVVSCPKCKTSIDAETIRKSFKDGNFGERLVGVILNHSKRKGKTYRIATEKDLNTFNSSYQYLKDIIQDLKIEWGFDPIPDEELPLMSGVFNVPIYGLDEWGKLFNYRQQLTLLIFMKVIKEYFNDLISENNDIEYSKALLSYLGIIFDRLADKNANLVVYDVTRDTPSHVFGRQALPMVWNYIEINPFTDIGWPNMTKWVEKVVEHCTNVSNTPATITMSSATSLPYPDNFFDAIFTDPPYYNSVPYADLSDFFYVWLKRTVGDLHPELFVTPLTPKSQEIAEMKGWDNKRYPHKDKQFFEKSLKKSFEEIYRVLNWGGIATIVYAHKTTEGWETIINALIDSGLIVTASWPISTEMTERLRAKKSATLSSSIYIVARKYDKEELGWFKEVKIEIEEYVPKKLDKLWEEGISGADFFIAAIGSAIEIFGKYKKIIDNEGKEVKGNKLLIFVRNVVTNYVIKNILHNGIADELSPLTKFYLLWRWNYQDLRVPFDEARKLSQSAGIDLANEWKNSFIVKRGKFIAVQGPDKREKKSLEHSVELIDVLHHVCLLWKDRKQDEMKSVLKKSGFGEGEVLYKVAQAISETLPNNSSEKKMIEGFLAGRDRIIQDMREDESQTKLV